MAEMGRARETASLFPARFFFFLGDLFRVAGLSEGDVDRIGAREKRNGGTRADAELLTDSLEVVVSGRELQAEVRGLDGFLPLVRRGIDAREVPVVIAVVELEFDRAGAEGDGPLVLDRKSVV